MTTTPPAPAASQPATGAPDTPLALVCEHLSDDLSGLVLRPWALPAVGPADVCVAVQAASLNFPDLLMTRGGYQFKPPVPFVPGMEGAGTVLAAGPASGYAVGDAVSFHARHGAIAQRVVLPASALAPLPAGVAPEVGAAAHVTGLTAWVSLVRLARLQAGDTLLVHGARGGVGQACVQLGRHLGARVIATASRPETLADLAAEGVPVLPASDFRDGVLELTGGRGADVIADPVGGDVFDQSQRCIAFNGQVLMLGFADGRIPTLAMNRLLIKGYRVIGVRAGEYGRHFPQHAREHLAAVQHLLATGVLRPHIGARFALADARQAFVAMAERRVTGKIVVTVDAPTKA